MCRWRGTHGRGGQKVRPRKRARLVTWPLWRWCPTHQQRVVRRSRQAQVPHQGFGTSACGQHEWERGTFAIEIRSEVLRDGSAPSGGGHPEPLAPGRLHWIYEGGQASERESSSCTWGKKTLRKRKQSSCEESRAAKKVTN